MGVVRVLLLAATIVGLLFGIARGDTVDAVRRSLAVYDARSLSIDARGTLEHRYEVDGEVAVSEDSVLTIRLKSGRGLISRKKVTKRLGKDPWRVQNDLVILDDGSVLACQATLDESLNQVSGPDAVSALLMWSERIAGQQDVNTRTVCHKVGDYACVLWSVGRTPLSYYLRDDSAIVEEAAGEDRVVIHADGEYGQATLEVAASSGWLPIAFRITKKPSDRCIEGTIQDWYMPKPEPDDANAVYPPGETPEAADAVPEVQSVIWEGKADNFVVDSEGHWSPRVMQITQTINYFAKSPEVYVTTIKTNECVFSPELAASDLRSNLAFPVGSQVTIADAEYLPFKWDGTRPVPGIGTFTSTSSPSRQQGRVEPLADDRDNTLALLVIVNVVFVLVLLAVFAIRRRHR